MKHGDTPHRYAFQKATLRLLMSLMFLAFTPTALPQSSPIDLMDLSLEELLNVQRVHQPFPGRTLRTCQRVYGNGSHQRNLATGGGCIPSQTLFSRRPRQGPTRDA